jgi:hypothetical protein
LLRPTGAVCGVDLRGFPGGLLSDHFHSLAGSLPAHTQAAAYQIVPFSAHSQQGGYGSRTSALLLEDALPLLPMIHRRDEKRSGVREQQSNGLSGAKWIHLPLQLWFISPVALARVPPYSACGGTTFGSSQAFLLSKHGKVASVGLRFPNWFANALQNAGSH